MIYMFDKLKHNVFNIYKILYICTGIKLEY